MVWLVDIVLHMEIPFISFTSPTSSIVVPGLSLMVGCEYLHLYWSGAGKTSQGTAIPGSSQQALIGISYSPQFGVYRWDGFPGGALSEFPFLQSLLHVFVPVFPLDSNSSGLKILRWVG